MIVSILDGQYIYGIDLSKKGAETFKISEENFNKLQSGSSVMIEGEIVEKEEIKEKKKTKKEIEKENEIIEKQVKSDKIVSKYTITDQLNIVIRILQTLSEDEELQAMGIYIDGVLKDDFISKDEDELSK